MIRRLLIASGCVLMMVAAGGCIFGTVKKVKKTVASVEDMAVDAIQNLLVDSTARAVAQLGIEGGYADTPEVRILLPDDLKGMSEALARLGLDDRLTALETSLNRAAEVAAAEVPAVFAAIIKHMKIRNVLDIIKAKDAAATAYLRNKAYAGLYDAMLPVVSRALQTVEAARAYAELKDRYNAIPLVKPCAFTIEAYVTAQALDRLFIVMAVAEKELRKDPSSAVFKVIKKIVH